MRTLIKIGDFSRLARLSIVTLRHYNDLGLLRPARIDPETGYRYYAPEQLPRLHRIIALKELGFSLEQVAHLLDDELPTEQLRGMLLLRRAELEQQVRAEQTRLSAVEARLRQIEQEGRNPDYDVVVRAVPALLVASIRDIVPAAAGIERLFDEVETFAADRRTRAQSPPLALYYDTDYREREIDVEVAVPLAARIQSAGRVAVRELDPIPAMACVLHSGSYASLDQASQALYGWIAAQGYRVAGPYREVYLRFGAGPLQAPLPPAYLSDDADAYVTELQAPVECG